MPILGVLVLFQRSRLAIVMFSETLCRRENFGGVVEGVGGESQRRPAHRVSGEETGAARNIKHGRFVMS